MRELTNDLGLSNGEPQDNEDEEAEGQQVVDVHMRAILCWKIDPSYWSVSIYYRRYLAWEGQRLKTFMQNQAKIIMKRLRNVNHSRFKNEAKCYKMDGHWNLVVFTQIESINKKSKVSPYLVRVIKLVRNEILILESKNKNLPNFTSFPMVLLNIDAVESNPSSISRSKLKSKLPNYLQPMPAM